jgi:hypothetical protein
MRFTTSQLRRSVDVRLRDLADILIYAQRKGDDFNYIVFYNNEVKSLILPYNIAKQYFKLYDTYEIVEDEIIKSKREKLINKLQKSKSELDNGNR